MTLVLKRPYETKLTDAGEVPVFPGTDASIHDFIDWMLVQRGTAGDFIELNPPLTRQHVRDYLLAVVPGRFLPRCEKRDWVPERAYERSETDETLSDAHPSESLEGIFGELPLFPGSRVPLYFLIDMIDADDNMDEFFYSWGNQVDPPAVEAVLSAPLPLSLRHAKSLI